MTGDGGKTTDDRPLRISSGRLSVVEPTSSRADTKKIASSIDLAEHDVERADDRRDVGQHVAAADHVHGLQMGETRRPDLALVGLVGAVGHEVDAELALG